MRLLAAERRRTVGFLSHSLHLCGTILLTLYSMVWDLRVLRPVPMIFFWPELLASFSSSTVFRFSSFWISMFWYCGAGFFGVVYDVNRSLPVLHCRPFFNSKRNTMRRLTQVTYNIDKTCKLCLGIKNNIIFVGGWVNYVNSYTMWCMTWCVILMIHWIFKWPTFNLNVKHEFNIVWWKFCIL